MADDYANMGHNEATARLGLLAEDARKGLERVANGEADTIEGWLAYGHALNEGRALFPSDEQFGQWVAENGLSQLGTHEVKRDERAAAIEGRCHTTLGESAPQRGPFT